MRLSLFSSFLSDEFVKEMDDDEEEDEEEEDGGD